MVPGWIISDLSVGLIFGLRKWNFFRLCYSMVEMSTVQWITCENVPTRNPWYCSAIASAKIARMLWAVTGMMMQRGAAGSHMVSLSGWTGEETLQSMLAMMPMAFLNWSVFANAPCRKDVLGEVVSNPVTRIDHD